MAEPEAVVIPSVAPDVADLLYGKPEAAEVPEAELEPEHLSVDQSEVSVQEEGDTPVENDAQAADADQESSPAEESQPEAEEVEIQTVSELAEHFEIDPEWVQTLKIEQKVNGEPVTVAIADALATHRKVTSGDQYLADAKQKAKATIETTAQQQQELAASLTAVNSLLQTMEQGVDSEVSNLDPTLRRDDPAEYAARKEQIRERREFIKNLRERATLEQDQAIQRARQQAEEALVAQLPQQQEVLLERLPDWSDDDRAGREKTEVVEYLTSQGFVESDIRAASFNGNVLALAVKAMRYDNAKSKSQASAKKVRKIPKTLKPGPKKTEGKPTPDPTDRVGILYPSN